MTEKAPTRAQLERELREAHEKLSAAQGEVVDASTTLRANVSQNVPKMWVRVLPNNDFGYEGVSYVGDDEVEMDGPTAIAMFQQGHVTIIEGPKGEK